MMATNSNQAEDIQKGVKELEKEITCPVCHDHFQEPKILPCLHYYCKGCVQALTRRAGESKPFSCPECRTPTVLPQNDPDRLPTAFFINRMTELHAKMEKAHGKVEAVCEQCAESKAVAFCRQCTNFICDNCVKLHKKLRVFADHKVATLEKLKEGGAKQILLKQAPPPMCKVHDEHMKIYCYECNHLICRDCILDDHTGHKYDFVKKAAPAIKEKLAECLAPLKETQVSLCDATKSVKSARNDIETQRASVVASIEQSFQELYKILDRRKRELLEKTTSLVKGKLDRLNVQEKGFEMASSTIQSLVEFVEQNIKNATDEELMIIHTQVMNRIDEEMKKHHQSSAADLEPVEKADIMVQVECTENFEKLCHEKAIVTTSPADLFNLIVPEKGTAESVDINNMSKVMLHTTFSCYKQQRKPVAIKVGLTNSVSGVVVPVKVEQKSDSTYEIQYTPSTRGRHQLKVTVNGLPVAGSPFPVFVRIPPTQLGKPLKILPGLKGFDVTFNSCGELVFAENHGDIILLDKGGNELRRITKSQHGFQSLFGVAVDRDDAIYVTDLTYGKVFKFDKYGTKIKAIKPAVKNFDARGVAVFGDYIAVADYRNRQLLVFTRDLCLEKTIDCHSSPCGVASDQDGKIYVCNYGMNCIQVFDTHGVFQYSFSNKGSASRTVDTPHSICVAGDLVYVTEWGTTHCVSVFTKGGNFITSFGKMGNNEGEFDLPAGLTMDSDGVLYVCDYTNNRIQLF